MRTAGSLSSPAGLVVAAGALFLSGCLTTTRPQQFRTFLLPPAPPRVAAEEPVADPPALVSASVNPYLASAPPVLALALPDLPKPSDTDFILKKANDNFAAGKTEYQAGKVDDARRHFNLAVEALLAAPEDISDRPRVEKRLEELIDQIYRLDVDKLNEA